jgi:hypothetical protein
VRFAVHRPGIPVASPRSHGVPRRDVPGRVHVRVAGETAGRAREARLALARLPVHVSARRAPLAREGRSDLLYPSGSFLLQPTHQQPPARPQDLAVEPCFLADPPARVLWNALRGSGHVVDLEVFDADNVEAACQVRAGFLGPVLPPVRFPGAQPGDGVLHLCAAFRSSLGASQPSLQPPHARALPPCQARHVQEFPCRQRRGYRDASVDPYYLAISRCWDGVGYGRESNMPAPGPVHGHPVGLHARRHPARPAKPHPPDLRHPDLADVAGPAAQVPLLPAPPHDPESLMPSGLAPRRPPSRVSWVEERGHRLGEVPQRLLLHHLRTSGQPGELRPRLGELPALLQVAWGALPAGMPVLVLLDGQVPDVPGVAAVVTQHLFLVGSGKQSVPGHANTLSSTSDISGEVKRRFLAGLKAGISTPRF